MTLPDRLCLAIALLSVGLLARSPFEGSKPGEGWHLEGVKLRWAPAGTFRMGSPATETGHRADEAQVDVTFTRGFWIGEYEVTQGEWKRIVGAFPDRPMTRGAGDNIPVYWINYPEAEAFCRRLTELARASGEMPRDWEFRLPTEAQWEYAARAGTTTAYAFGDTLNTAQANFRPALGDPATRSGGSVPVGSYSPNAWGIHDMHGNVWEWCRDWYYHVLPGGTDPETPRARATMNRDGTYSRVRRGGAWIEADNRSATRLRYEPDRRSDHIGFRVVAVPLP